MGVSNESPREVRSPTGKKESGMSATPSTSQGTTFHATLVDLLSQAIADYPSWATKLSKAATLVERGAVIPERGGFAVESECTPGATYWVDATSCTCPDFQRRGAYCKHQLAVGMQRAIEKRLAGERRVRPAAASEPVPCLVSARGREYLDGAKADHNGRPMPALTSEAYRLGYTDGRNAALADPEACATVAQNGAPPAA
jgi:hypothetical protein